MSKILTATFGQTDKPLVLGQAEIPCYVLEDGTRVLVQGSMIKALGMSRGSAGSGGDRLAGFVSTKALSEFVSKDLLGVITHPIKFKAPNGSTAYGYEATVLVDICDAVLEARSKGKLNYQQEHVAKACEALVRSFAKVGIIALIDETTGYQQVRDRKALQAFLDKFLQKEARKWIKTFPDEFFESIFKMKGWTWSQASQKKPGVVGHYINNYVYARSGPGLLKKLRELNPVVEKTGRRATTHHSYTTKEYGLPELEQHLRTLIAFAKAAGYNWDNWTRMVERAFPKYNDQLTLDFTAEDDNGPS